MAHHSGTESLLVVTPHKFKLERIPLFRTWFILEAIATELLEIRLQLVTMSMLAPMSLLMLALLRALLMLAWALLLAKVPLLRASQLLPQVLRFQTELLYHPAKFGQDPQLTTFVI